MESSGKKSTWSYGNMIALALTRSETGQLSVSEIYDFICEHFPYYRTAPPSWKNSVRHNLCFNKKLEKIEISDGTGRQRFVFAILPAKQAKIDADLAKCGVKEESDGGRQYVYTSRQNSQRVAQTPLKRLNGRKVYTSRSEGNISKCRSAILSRRNAKSHSPGATPSEEQTTAVQPHSDISDELTSTPSVDQDLWGISENHFDSFIANPWANYSSPFTQMIEYDITFMSNL